MDLSKILSISGKNGLYKLINQGKTNFIVESLEDGKRMPAFSHDGISTLDNIAIFTDTEDMPLEKVFQSIFKHLDGAPIEGVIGDSEKMKQLFETVLPDYDKERVYVSNIKKVFSWYNLLIKHNLIDLEEKEEPTEGEEQASE